MSDLIAVESATLLNPASGEMLERTPENATSLLLSLRRIKSQLGDAIKECEAVLVEESQKVGTKTLHVGGETVVISGGKDLNWDLELLEMLREEGLPEARYNELVVAHVEYKVNAAVANQISGSNPRYKEIIDAARTYTEKRQTASVKA